MGSKKNASTHVSRGKFKKRKVPKKATAVSSSMPSPPLNGSRIINLENLQEHVQTIVNHAISCPSTSRNSVDDQVAVTMNETHRDGLASTLTTHCSNCNEEFTLHTSSKVKGLTGKPYWESNVAATWGQMSTGGGHSRLEESMAVLGVPVMTKKAFMGAERRIGQWWQTLLQESMKAAGEEEKAIALAKNRMHDGIPAITVIVDGGWSKRAHKHSYNAKSGVGIIIGKETGKILFMGVRNKYCAVCSKVTDGNPPPKHDCYLNWSTSSSAMEADIILEGFEKAYDQHGLRYMEYIGDGDSSVQPKLVEKLPWGFAIKKLECANHAVKCFRASLENLVSTNSSYKGRGKLTEAMRKRLTKAARSAIIMRSKETNKQAAVRKLQHDLMNIPLHCFGYHEKCSADFCKTKQQQLNATLQSNSPLLADQPALSEQSISQQPLSPSSLQSPQPNDSTSSTSPRSEPEQMEDIEDIIREQETAWNDATSDEGLDDVRDIPIASHQNIDQAMLCDIQRILSRLVAKAPQLISRHSIFI